MPERRCIGRVSWCCSSKVVLTEATISTPWSARYSMASSMPNRSRALAVTVSKTSGNGARLAIARCTRATCSSIRCRSPSSTITRSGRRARCSTHAMPRSSSISSGTNASAPARTTSSRTASSPRSSATMAARHGPRPSTRTWSAPVRAAATSAATCGSPGDRPTTVSTVSGPNSRPTSASSDSRTRSTAARSAASSSRCSESTARNSTSCDVLHESEVIRPAARSAQRHGEDGLVVVADDAFRAGDLAVGVEAGERGGAGTVVHQAPLGQGAVVTEDRAPADAVEDQQGQQRYLAELPDRLSAGGIRGGERGVHVAGGEPGGGPLGYAAGAGQRPGRRVGTEHVPDRHVAAPGDRERPGQRELRERRGVVLEAVRRAVPVQVHVQGRAVVEGVHVVSGAAGDHHAVAAAPPAVPYRQPDRVVAADGRGHHGLLQDLSIVELVRRLQPHVVPGPAADERYRRAEHPVGATDHLLLVAGQGVGQHEGRPVPGVRQRQQSARDRLADRAGLVVQAAGVGALYGEVTTETHHDDAAGQRRPGPDLTGRGTADGRNVAGHRGHPGEQFGEVVAEGGEHDEQLGIGELDGVEGRRGAGAAGRAVPRVPDANRAPPGVVAPADRGAGTRDGSHHGDSVALPPPVAYSDDGSRGGLRQDRVQLRLAGVLRPQPERAQAEQGDGLPQPGHPSSTVASGRPVSRPAASRYRSGAAPARTLASTTGTSSAAQATPCGTATSTQTTLANPCTAPSFALASAIPLSSAHSAMSVRAPTSVPSAYTRRSPRAARRSPSRASASVTGLAFTDTNGSRHWVRASRPLDAVAAGGQPTVSSGSTSATAGSITGLRMLTLTPCSGTANTEFVVASEPVPAVVGTATHGTPGRGSRAGPGTGR